MVKIKYKTEDVAFKVRQIFSANVGILDSGFYCIKTSTDMPKMFFLSADMPDYTPFICKQNIEVIWNIAGYDDDLLHATERMIGESIERYAAYTAYFLFQKKHFLLSSYNSLIAQKKNVVDLKYYNVFKSETYLKMNKFNSKYGKKPLKSDDEIEWFRCNSLLKGEVWVPSAMFFLAFNKNAAYTSTCEKIYYIPTSTGTATHVTLEHAFYNALVESIQIHYFNKYWYFNTKAKKIVIDNEAIKKEILKIIGDSNIEAEFFFYKNDFQLYIIGCYVFSSDHQFPAISFGVQAHSDLKTSIVRALMEAISVYVYNEMQILNSTDPNFLSRAKDMQKDFVDLETNALFYANPQNYKICMEQINKRWNLEIKYSEISKNTFKKNIKNELSRLLCLFYNRKIDVFYQDITPIEVNNWYKTVRVLIPDFTPVFIPSYPFDNHPSFNQKSSFFIHPLA